MNDITIHNRAGVPLRVSSHGRRTVVSVGGRVGPVVLRAFDPVVNRVDLVIPAGSTIGDAVRLGLYGLNAEQRDQVRVIFDGREVPQEMWDRVKPKVWDRVLIRVIPQNLFRSILTLVVAVAATALGQYYLLPTLTPTLGAFGAQIATSAIVAGATIGGALLLNALIPTRGPGEEKKVFSIDGMQNEATPDAPVPQLFGEMRFAPPYACIPYTETVGDDRFIVAVFLLGQGPMDLSEPDPRIGMTSLSEFVSGDGEVVGQEPGEGDGGGAASNDFQINYREGYADDAPLELYTRQVVEEPLSIDLTFAVGAQTRFSARDVTELEVEFYFAGGLFRVDGDGDIKSRTTTIKIEHRLVGTDDWVLVTDFSVTAAKRTPFWRAHRWSPETRGQYEVRITRTSGDDTNDGSKQSDSKWTGLRGFRPEYPLNYEQPMALAELRIRATGKLNGTLDTFNLFARRVCLDWNAATSTWVTRTTSKPASIARLILQGPQNTYPEPDSALDLEAFEEWHEYCTDKGLTCNGYVTAAMTREDALADVCHAGRAFPYRRGNQWTVVVDQPRTQFYNHISPRNSWGLEESDPPANFPDAYVVSFRDQENNYADAKRVVLWPGFPSDDTPVVVEELNLPFKTDPAEVWREARRRQYEAIYRRRGWTVNQDFEHLSMGRGDAAFLGHPVIDRRQSGGRVRSLPGGDIVELDELVTMEADGAYRCRFQASDGSTLDREVWTEAGETRAIRLNGTGSLPVIGNHAMFYSIEEPILEVIVKNIERNENHNGRLTLVQHAPEIDELTDAEVAPAWDGRIGEIVEPSTAAPGVPSITGFETDGDTLDITAFITAGSGVSPATYTLAHRLSGGGSFATVTAPAGTGAVVFSGYEAGDEVEVKVLATSAQGTPSAYSDVETYSVHVGPTADSALIFADNETHTADAF